VAIQGKERLKTVVLLGENGVCVGMSQSFQGEEIGVDAIWKGKISNRAVTEANLM